MSSGAPVYNFVTVVENTVLYACRVLREKILTSSQHTHTYKRVTVEVMNKSFNFIVVIVSQCIHTSQCQIVLLKCIPFLFVKDISVTLSKRKKGIRTIKNS